jgi:DNA polymerase
MRDELARLAREVAELLRIEASSPGAAHALAPRAGPRTVPPEDAIAEIADRVRACTRCPLCHGRRNAVPGEGSARARLLLVGEAPGEDEDRQGLPFVGRAGELLTKMLAAISVRRDEVFIANVLKCRPPGNRDPAPEEITACRGWLAAQIAAIRPAVIVTLGRVPTRLLLDTTQGILALRGVARPFTYEGGTAILMPTLHPAYLLRSPAAKRDAWEDLKEVHRLLREITGDWPPPLPARPAPASPDASPATPPATPPP